MITLYRLVNYKVIFVILLQISARRKNKLSKRVKEKHSEIQNCVHFIINSEINLPLSQGNKR